MTINEAIEKLDYEWLIKNEVDDYKRNELIQMYFAYTKKVKEYKDIMLIENYNTYARKLLEFN